ncbi:MAG: Mut7-C RNAse domain-containing protein [Syntrophobacterales bacterium]|nr:MAG: Mut7-C RNAse domain-containing protein [Syntrophobacterales bacterium]
MAERFIVDSMLGKLAKWLRILGYDTLYWRGNDWQRLMEKGKGRIFLTRTTKFSRGGSFQGVIQIRDDNPNLQLKGVIRELALKIDEKRIFSRCLICNRQLKKMSKKELEGRIPNFVLSTYSEFSSCPECSRIYWKGTHQENIRRKIEELSSLGIGGRKRG